MTTPSEHPSQTWQERLSLIVDTMRDMSRHTDPQEMVRAYGERIGQLLPLDRRVSLSRRGLADGQYRITRSTTWTEVVNPWQDKERLPLFTGGLLAKLIYGGEPQVFDNLELDADEPAAEYLSGFKSLLAIPMYDQGESINMVIMLQQAPGAFDKEQIPDLVWRTILFGRATSNLVLKDELERTYQALDRELKVVGNIQRALLPAALPQIKTLDLAAVYQPATRAGGDYYDFFPLPDGKWGIFIADVSGHGTPAAVLMAVTHCLAHTHPGSQVPPGKVLDYLNHQLTTLYTNRSETFVTAFYAIYDPQRRLLTYASAGHNPPRLKRCQDGSLLSLNRVGGLPLGIATVSPYQETEQQLQVGDQIIFYTDGITEAHNPQGQLFGIERMDQVLENCSVHAQSLLDAVLQSVEEFSNGRPADDDRTLIVARIT